VPDVLYGHARFPLRDDLQLTAAGAGIPNIMSAAFSAITTTVALVLPPMMLGNAEASTTRNPSIPRTRSCESTTEFASVPIRQVLTGWCTVDAARRTYSASCAAPRASGPGATSTARYGAKAAL